ncbi:hypothetical protein STXM2123_2656 [Streptomyces sp. F-3]|nr:hypothetical protein STXM2123_2656 [Streptomyces sp. F-3]
MARDWAVSSAFALLAGANAVYSPPVPASARSRTTTAARGWRRRADSFFTDYPAIGFLRRYFQDVHGSVHG